jgi:transposase
MAMFVISLIREATTAGGTTMVRRGEITDRAWEHIEPLLPREGGKRGGRWRDHRTVVNGILWKLRTGSPWRDLPERYGPWQTCFVDPYLAETTEEPDAVTEQDRREVNDDLVDEPFVDALPGDVGADHDDVLAVGSRDGLRHGLLDVA